MIGIYGCDSDPNITIPGSRCYRIATAAAITEWILATCFIVYATLSVKCVRNILPPRHPPSTTSPLHDSLHLHSTTTSLYDSLHDFSCDHPTARRFYVAEALTFKRKIGENCPRLSIKTLCGRTTVPIKPRRYQGQGQVQLMLWVMRPSLGVWQRVQRRWESEWYDRVEETLSN
jgi:hypothetical protein